MTTMSREVKVKLTLFSRQTRRRASTMADGKNSVRRWVMFFSERIGGAVQMRVSELHGRIDFKN
jgi:hypothetical protein